MQSSSGATVTVHDVRKAAGGQLFIHKCEVATGTVSTGDAVTATIDASFRRRTKANHTATHLLQAALKKTLGDDVAQQGSLVRSDGLRFDFSLPRPMTQDEIAAVEKLMNRWIEARRCLANATQRVRAKHARSTDAARRCAGGPRAADARDGPARGEGGGRDRDVWREV